MRSERGPLRPLEDLTPGRRVQAVCPACLRVLDTAKLPAVCPLCGRALDHRPRVGPQRRSPALPGEHSPLRRLEELAPGTRVQLAPGRVGTLLEVNFTRAIVELDRGDDRRREIAPSCEVEVLTTVTPRAEASLGPARDEKGPETALRPAEMRNTDRGRPGSPTGARYGSEGAPAACPICGRPIDGRGRYCSSAHRQRAYRQRHLAPSPATATVTAEKP